MIRYTLSCEQGHSFESWFQSGGAFDTLVAARMVNCPECGSLEVKKALMAPPVRPGRNSSASSPEPAAEPRPMAATPDPNVVHAIETLRTHVEKTSEYVGDKFAREARAMHVGDKPSKPIHGEANAEEARQLIEDGVPALPLPFIPRQKTN